jgi:hypothetical protein
MRSAFRLPPKSETGFWGWYNEYLASPQWQAKRVAVIRRDRVCQGCGGEGNHCHHLSYDDVGREFLFQLMLLCEDCHDRWHLQGRYSVPRAKVRARWGGGPPAEAPDPRTQEQIEEDTRVGCEGLLSALADLDKVEEVNAMSDEDQEKAARNADLQARIRNGLFPAHLER